MYILLFLQQSACSIYLTSMASMAFTASPRRMMPPLTRLKMAAASQHSLPSAAADAFAVVASMPDHSIVEKSKASPVQPYWRLQPSKRLTRAASSSLEKRGSVCGFPTLGSGCTDITDFLSVGTRISYRWVPRNRVGAFILRSADRFPLGAGGLPGLSKL